MGRKVIDLTGQVFGELICSRMDTSKPRGALKSIYWICECSCGGTTSVSSANLRSGKVLACGHRRGGHNRKYPTEHIAQLAAIKRAVEWNRENAARRKEIVSQYARTHPHASAAKEGKRRARKRNQTCACCSNNDFLTMYEIRPAGTEIDHIIPLARSGPHCLSNLQFLPEALNRSKGAKLPEELLP